ncbi:MAG: hypothetical protein KIT69_06560 [Propionibacteriaceae bacterium]|nr:hypothetical protein [Propionibacteriaceae bacterium]
MSPSTRSAGGTRRLLIVSHCVLNQNAVVQPLARSAGVMRSAADWALEAGYELFQLPCPEFRFAGPHRRGGSFDDYNTAAFHDSNERLLESVIQHLLRYRDAGYEIVGGLHVQGSPACDPDTGNWITDLLAATSAAGIEIRQLWQLPQTASGEFRGDDPQAWFGDPATRRCFPEDATSLTPAQVARRRAPAATPISGPTLPINRTEASNA